MRIVVVTAAVAALVAVPALALAEPKRDVKPKSPEPVEGEAMPEERASFGVAAAPVLPVGNLSDAFAFGLGATLGFDYAVHAHVQLVARTGYVHHFPKSGLDATLGALPIWAGARWTLGVGDRLYAEGALGPTILFAHATVAGVSASDSETKLGAALGGGWKFDRFDVGARLVFWDLGHAGDSAALMATAGFTFASF